MYLCTVVLEKDLFASIQGRMAHHGRTIVGVLDTLIALAELRRGSLSGGTSAAVLQSYGCSGTSDRRLSALQHRLRGSASDPDTRANRRFADQRLCGRIESACLSVSV